MVAKRTLFDAIEDIHSIPQMVTQEMIQVSLDQHT